MEHAINLVQDIVDVVHDIAVPEPHDNETGSLQLLAPAGIASCTVRVLTTIELDHQFRIDAHEVRNVSLDRDLPTKLPSMEVSIAQIPPQSIFCEGLFAPEPAGECSGICPRHHGTNITAGRKQLEPLTRFASLATSPRRVF